MQNAKGYYFATKVGEGWCRETPVYPDAVEGPAILTTPAQEQEFIALALTKGYSEDKIRELVQKNYGGCAIIQLSQLEYSEARDRISALPDRKPAQPHPQEADKDDFLP